MKKLIAAALLAGGLAASFGAGTAQADTAVQVSAAEQFYGDRLYTHTCILLDASPTLQTAAAIVLTVYGNSGYEIPTVESATNVVSYAVYTYCPRHWNLLSTAFSRANGGA